MRKKLNYERFTFPFSLLAHDDPEKKNVLNWKWREIEKNGDFELKQKIDNDIFTINNSRDR